MAFCLGGAATVPSSLSVRCTASQKNGSAVPDQQVALKGSGGIERGPFVVPAFCTSPPSNFCPLPP